MQSLDCLTRGRDRLAAPIGELFGCLSASPDPISSGTTSLGSRMTAVKELIEKGEVRLTDLGFFAGKGDQYVPLGFNPWPESHGKMAIGKLAEMETVLADEEIGVVAKSTEVRADEKRQRIITDWRKLFRFKSMIIQQVTKNRVLRLPVLWEKVRLRVNRKSVVVERCITVGEATVPLNPGYRISFERGTAE